MLENFIHKMKLDNKSENTIRSYCERLQDYFHFANNQVSQHTLDQYIIYKKKSNNTMNLFLCALKKYCKYNNIVLDFPEKRKKEIKIKTHITEKEMNDNYIYYFGELFNNYSKQKLIFKFLFYTGLRKGEMVKLQRRDFDFTKKQLYVKDTKTNRDRTVPLSKKIISDVKKYFNLYEEKSNAFNINRYQIDYIFRIINKQLKIENKITPHSLRRSFARYCYFVIGFDILNLQCMLGHTNIKQTEEYLGITSADVMNKAKILDY